VGNVVQLVTLLTSQVEKLKGIDTNGVILMVSWNKIRVIQLRPYNLYRMEVLSNQLCIELSKHQKMG